MSYTESYYSLSHGTDQLSAERIISEGFLVKGDANSLDMIFGVETIYCVKDISIISNKRI